MFYAQTEISVYRHDLSVQVYDVYYLLFAYNIIMTIIFRLEKFEPRALSNIEITFLHQKFLTFIHAAAATTTSRITPGPLPTSGGLCIIYIYIIITSETGLSPSIRLRRDS